MARPKSAPLTPLDQPPYEDYAAARRVFAYEARLLREAGVEVPLGTDRVFAEIIFKSSGFFYGPAVGRSSATSVECQRVPRPKGRLGLRD